MFLKIGGDVRNSRCTTAINDTGGKFATGINDTSANVASSSACVVDTGGKFATGVVDTGVIDTGVNDASGKQREQYQTAANLK